MPGPGRGDLGQRREGPRATSRTASRSQPFSGGSGDALSSGCSAPLPAPCWLGGKFAGAARSACRDPAGFGLLRGLGLGLGLGLGGQDQDSLESPGRVSGPSGSRSASDPGG